MNPLFITGATGWIGRSVLHYLHKILPRKDFNDYIIPFASSEKIIHISNGDGSFESKIRAHPLSEITSVAAGVKRLNLIHTAFLTKDRIHETGISHYIHANQQITECLGRLLQQNPETRSVLFSSGAAAEMGNGNSRTEISVDSNPYAFLKRQEEILFATHASSLILRIYALSGRFIRTPQSFALGSFLLSAIAGQSIVILAKRPVVRGYVSAMDVSALAWAWLQSSDDPPSTPLDAVTETIDLLSLAEMITSMYDLPAVHHSIDAEAIPDCYMAYSQPFLDQLHRYGLVPTPLEQQIRDTSSGLISDDTG